VWRRRSTPPLGEQTTADDRSHHVQAVIVDETEVGGATEAIGIGTREPSDDPPRRSSRAMAALGDGDGASFRGALIAVPGEDARSEGFVLERKLEGEEKDMTGASIA
jgi:hypothetical protein